MTLDLPPSAGSFAVGILALIFAAAIIVASIVFAALIPLDNSIVLALRAGILIAAGLYALKKWSGDRVIIDKTKARARAGRTLFGVLRSFEETDLKGYSGVQMSYKDEWLRVELTGFEKEKLALVEFASEDHARGFSDRLRQFLSS
jgi:hypothetical protein